MELLLSDSSRANLSRVATSPGVEAPGCQVKSPFSCVAVRRGTAVVFDSSESLNACPQLRGRAVGPLLGGVRSRELHGPRPRRAAHHGPGGKGPLRRGRRRSSRCSPGRPDARIGTVRAFEKTQLQASTDSLTGLVNRRTAEKDLRELMQAARPFAVVIADLDKFKQLNDTHGHEAGDRALRLFSQTAEQALRDNDLVARWGGEEFVIVLPDLDRFQAVKVLERMRHDLAAAHSGTRCGSRRALVSLTPARPTASRSCSASPTGDCTNPRKAGRDRVTVGDGESAAKAKEDGIAKPTIRRRCHPRTGFRRCNGIVVTRHATPRCTRPPTKRNRLPAESRFAERQSLRGWRSCSD